MYNGLKMYECYIHKHKTLYEKELAQASIYLDMLFKMKMKMIVTLCGCQKSVKLLYS